MQEHFIRLEARLQPNIRNTLGRISTVFTRSAITPSKVNRFGRNLEHSEYIVWGWIWQILGAIRAVARVGEPGEMLFFGQVNNARLLPICRRPNFTKFGHNTSIGVEMNPFGAEF